MLQLKPEDLRPAGKFKRDIALHPDGKRLAVPCSDGTLRVYDASPK